jgi:hypothetical protein
MSRPACPESAVLAACIQYLAKAGIIAWRNSTGCARYKGPGGPRFVRYGLPGSGDILGILPGGRFLSIQTKSTTGRLSPEQCVWLETVRGAGAVAIVARSVDDLIEGLEAAGFGMGELFAKDTHLGVNDFALGNDKEACKHE